MKKVIGIRCVKCGSTFTYARARTKDRKCRNCEHVEPLKQEVKDD